MMRLGAGLLVALLLAASWPMPTAAQAAPPPWWPPHVISPDGFRDGWNLRIPLELRNPEGTARPAGSPVQVHLDLGALMLQAGWPRAEGGLGAFPRSFNVDPDSVRLLQYTAGWGSIGAEVPFIRHTNWLEPDQTTRFGKVQAADFHPQRNALVTLEWQLLQPLAAFDRLYYYAYFEIVENSDKAPPSFGPEQVERLDGLYWTGAGTSLFGHFPGSTSTGPSLVIIGTQPSTTVTVSAYRGSPFAVPDNRPNSGNPLNPFTIGAGQQIRYSLGVSATSFRVDADKPVLVARHVGSGAVSGAFVPGPNGYLDTSFQAPLIGTAVYVLAPPQTPAGGVSVTVQTGASTLFTGTLSASTYQYVNLPNQLSAASNFRVTSSSPILVQYAPHRPAVNTPTVLAQAPSVLGSPVGSTFFASTLGDSQGSLVVSAVGEQALLRVVDKAPAVWRTLANNVRVDPAPSLVELAGSTLPRAPQSTNTDPFTIPLTIERLAGNEAPAGQRGPFTLAVGHRGGTVRQMSPYGGQHGLHFFVQGPHVAFPFYDFTKIRLIHHWDGGREETFIVDEGTPTQTLVASNAMVEIVADKPLAVTPIGDAEGLLTFLAARPSFLTPIIGAGEYRGFLFEMRPSSNLDPVYVDALPGSKVRIPFVVTNLAKWSDGNALGDTIRFSTVAAPSDFAGEIKFEQPQLPLSTNQPRETYLEVSLPQDMPPDSDVTLTVRAVSTGNSNMKSEFTAVVSARQTFGVKLWFGLPSSSDGSKFAPLGLSPGDSEPVPFVLENTGSGPDSFSLDIPPPAGGWTAVVESSGNPVTSVGPLPAGAKVGLTLRATAPSSESAGPALITVNASSLAKSTARDKLLLSARLSLGAGLQFDGGPLVSEISPGGTATYDLTLKNTGKDAIGVVMRLVRSLPTGWTAAITVPANSEGKEQSLTPGLAIDLRVQLRAPATAPADLVVSALLSAQGQREHEDVSDGVVLGAIVRQVHNLTLQPLVPLVASPGQNVTVTARVANRGNGPEVLRLAPGTLPAKWQFESKTALALAPNAPTGSLVGKILVPRGTAAGVYPVGFSLETGDGTKVALNTTVEVSAQRTLAMGTVPAVTLQAGDPGLAQVRLTNLGNAPEEVSLAAEAEPGWEVTLVPDKAQLAAGGSRSVGITWRTPANAPAGAHAIRITATSLLGGGSATADVSVSVATPNVTLENVLVPPSADPSEVVFVTVVLRNPTAVPARDVEVRLVSGTEILDSVRIESVGANGTSVVALRTASGSLGGAKVVWGAGANESFSAYGSRDLPAAATPAAAPSRSSPAPAAFLLLLALGVVVALRRRCAP